MNERVNPDHRRRALELHRGGVSLAEIGRRLRISRQAAFKLVKKAQVDAQREEMARKAPDIAITLKDPVEPIQEPPRRVPTAITLTGQATDEVDCQSPEAADSWDIRKWRSWP